MRRVSGPSWAGPWDPEACEARTLSGPGPRPSGGSRGCASERSRGEASGSACRGGAPAAELPKFAESPRKRSRWLLLPSGWHKALPPCPPGAPPLRLLLLVAVAFPAVRTAGTRLRRAGGWLQLRLCSRRAARPAHCLSLPRTRGVLPFALEALPRLGTRDPEHWRSRLCLVSCGAPAAAPGPPAGSFVGAPQRVTLGQGGLVDRWVRPGCPLSPEIQGARCPLGHTWATKRALVPLLCSAGRGEVCALLGGSATGGCCRACLCPPRVPRVATDTPLRCGPDPQTPRTRLRTPMELPGPLPAVRSRPSCLGPGRWPSLCAVLAACHAPR